MIKAGSNHYRFLVSSTLQLKQNYLIALGVILGLLGSTVGVPAGVAIAQEIVPPSVSIVAGFDVSMVAEGFEA